jgi:hypothetical protein
MFHASGFRSLSGDYSASSIREFVTSRFRALLLHFVLKSFSIFRLARDHLPLLKECTTCFRLTRDFLAPLCRPPRGLFIHSVSLSSCPANTNDCTPCSMYIASGKAFKPNPNSFRKSHNGTSRCTPVKSCFLAVYSCFRAFLKAFWLFTLIVSVSNFQVCNGSPRGQQQGRLRPDQAAPHACDEKISQGRDCRFLNPCVYPPRGDVLL